MRPPDASRGEPDRWSAAPLPALMAEAARLRDLEQGPGRRRERRAIADVVR